MKLYRSYLIAMLVFYILTQFFNLTGLIGHVVLTVLALAFTIVFTVKTKKDWSKPALEIISRVCFLLAIITGIVLVRAGSVAAVVWAHRIFATVFALLVLILNANKALKKA